MIPLPLFHEVKQQNRKRIVLAAATVVVLVSVVAVALLDSGDSLDGMLCPGLEAIPSAPETTAEHGPIVSADAPARRELPDGDDREIGLGESRVRAAAARYTPTTDEIHALRMIRGLAERYGFEVPATDGLGHAQWLELTALVKAAEGELQALEHCHARILIDLMRDRSSRGQLEVSHSGAPVDQLTPDERRELVRRESPQFVGQMVAHRLRDGVRYVFRMNPCEDRALDDSYSALRVRAELLVAGAAQIVDSAGNSASSQGER